MAYARDPAAGCPKFAGGVPELATAGAAFDPDPCWVEAKIAPPGRTISAQIATASGRVQTDFRAHTRDIMARREQHRPIEAFASVESFL